MNKYQRLLLNNIEFTFYSKDLDKNLNYKIDNDELILYQDTNYNITTYNLIVKSDSISKIEVLDDKWITIKGYINTFNINIDFSNQIRKLKIIFNDDIADPIIFNLNYIYANRDDYDLVLKEKSDELSVKKACIRVTTGSALINVLFQPVSSNYAYTIVELYSYMDNAPLLMARYKVSDDLFFIPIKDLAYGTYKIKVIEYGDNNEVIFTSPFYLVTLQRPRSQQNQTYDR